MTTSLPFSDADRALIIALRRDLHRNPELSWKEVQTQIRLERALRECGVTDIRHVATTGLVGRVPGTGGGATVAIRGDIDALPITEETGLPYASENPGVMHACGHDMHASWAVGAALLLTRNPAAGDVVIVLQPAEELGKGARAMIDAGAVDGVKAIFGGHVDRRFDVGQVVAQAGPVAASTDTFRISLRGRGGHGARPHISIDPIVGAGALILALQTIVSRRLDPASPGVLSIGAIHGGNAANVIPDVVDLAGTVRTTTESARTLILAELERLTNAVAAAHGVVATVQVSRGTPPLVNGDDAAGWAASAVRGVLGDDAVRPLGITNMGGEDFSYYLERMTGCFMRIGSREPGGLPLDVHTATFAPAEDALFTASAVLAQCARIASSELSS
ncbi:MAG: M20 family metallopeptidase [Gemmatimonadetes bacterium]|nr:M20 family metallopeptidase [Gemmatimonadota bacterium]